MYKTSELKNLLYFDIETLPSKWEDLKLEKQNIWLDKYHTKFSESELAFRTKQDELFNNTKIKKPITPKYIFEKYAGLFPEFSRIWCISFGVFNLTNNIEINTLQSDDEKKLIEDFLTVLSHYESFNLAGCNIENFDIPFILTRMLKHGLHNYPRQLQLKNAKPWTTNHVDFQKDWKGMTNQMVTLDLICETLDISSPKEVFKNHEFTTLMLNEEISIADGIAYCERDVKALMLCMQKCSSDKNNFAPTVEKKTWAKK